MDKEDKKYFEEVLERLKFIMGTRTNGVVAERLGMTETSFSNRKKKGTVVYEYIIPWSLKANVSLDYILHGKGNPPPRPEEQSAAEPDNQFPQALYNSGMEDALIAYNPEAAKIRELADRLKSIEPRTLKPEEWGMVKDLTFMADRILKSKNIMLRETLKSNIVTFSALLDDSVRLDSCELEISILKKERSESKNKIED